MTLRQEFQYLRVSWPWLLLFAILQAYHSVMHNIVYYLEGVFDVIGGSDHALVDLGFKLVPEIDTSTMSFLPTNGILYALFGILGLFLIAPFAVNVSFS